MTIFARPSEWSRSQVERPEGLARDQRYFAFLSYSHRDDAMARWLHESLEKFRTPRNLVGRLTEHGVVPRQLTPIFRDLRELPAADDLGTEIRSALAGSRFLVVLCSPAAAQSKWTNAEIEAFKKARPDGCVLAAVVEGEPFASDIAGREREECLPEALRFKFDRRGRATTKRAEPLAADLREPGEARRLGFLKLVAGMLGVGLDDLVQREALRRQRRMAMITAASLLGMVMTSGLALMAVGARDTARDQRREAEGLIEFMLGDLRSKLDPLGRLDVLDSVGERAFAYYQKQDPSSLPDESLVQRSKALTLMGEIASTRGDLATASRLYQEAFSGTGEAMRRNPSDPQRLFDHAQNVFWIGYTHWQRGDLHRAAASFRTYRRLADGMMALEPMTPKWRLEGKFADTNLGSVLMEQRRYREAADAFQSALNTAEALAAAEPASREYQNALLEALAWLGDARKGEGRLDEAREQRERQIALLDKFMAANPDDKEFARKAMTAHKALSGLLADSGDIRAALEHARRGSRFADALIRTEPANTEWIEFASTAQLALASLLRHTGDNGAAASTARSACEMIERLTAKDRSVRRWNEDLRLSCLAERSRIAIAAGSGEEALRYATQAVALAEASRGKTPIDAAIHRAVAHQVAGDAYARVGRAQQAREEWLRAARAWPANVALEPDYLAQRALTLHAAGDLRGARALVAQLEAMGYRHPKISGLRGNS